MNDPARKRAAADLQAPFCVLVVDDDPDMVAFLARLLQREGMEVETAENGDAALAQVASAVPDLVLLDVMMPGASGFDVCRRLKSDEATALVPVVLVTSSMPVMFSSLITSSAMASWPLPPSITNRSGGSS
jgi:CheY-like chemotaxis protein